MDERTQGTALTGLVVGALVALSFALLIRLLPASAVLETHWRIAVYLACAVAAVPTVWFLQWVARMRRLDWQDLLMASGLFDEPSKSGRKHAR